MTRRPTRPSNPTGATEIRISELIIPALWEAFNDKTHAHIIATSGRAGTKSSGLSIKAIFQGVLDDEEPGSVVVIRKRHNKLRKTVYKEIKRAIKRLGLSEDDFIIHLSPMEITYKRNGNSIFFAGSDSLDATKGIIDEDRPIKLVFIDEVSEFFESANGGQGEDELLNIEATFSRGNTGAFQMLYAYNPPKNPNAPVVQWAAKMAKRPDVLRVHCTYQDVPPAWLGKALLASAELLRLTDERQWRWLWLGESIGVDELIFYMFSRERHVQPPALKAYGYIGIGIDYGQMNATTFQAFGLNMADHTVDGLAEYYHSGREGTQKSPSEYGKDFAAFVQGLAIRFRCRYFVAYIDPSAKGLAEEIKRATRGLKVRLDDQDAGLTVVIKDAENDVALGISRVQKLLTFDLLRISPAQRYAIDEFGLYEYDPKTIERGAEKPIKANDHCMDAIRYLTMGMWSKLKPYLPKDEKEEEAAK